MFTWVAFFVQAKMDKMKAEGTYMTKAQREKQARARAALEQMMAAGLVQIPAEEGAEGAEGGAAGGHKKPVYGKPKKKKDAQQGGAKGQQVEQKKEGTFP